MTEIAQCMCGYCQWLRGRLPEQIEARRAQERERIARERAIKDHTATALWIAKELRSRSDVGHEMVLPERARPVRGLR